MVSCGVVNVVGLCCCCFFVVFLFLLGRSFCCLGGSGGVVEDFSSGVGFFFLVLGEGFSLDKNRDESRQKERKTKK